MLARRAAHGTVSAKEARAFQAINSLTPSLRAPAWLVMQSGSFGAIPVAAAIAFPRGRSTALALVIDGSAVWALCKVVKRVVKRGRPADHLSGVVVYGRAQRGRGFPSGHAAVSTTLTVVGSRLLPRGSARLAWGIPVIVCGARLYVGAHLPLDVAGGACLGVAAGTVARLVLDA
jgi:undecaprenyl-diphosphatase